MLAPSIEPDMNTLNNSAVPDDHTLAWDPVHVRDLLRKAQAEGQRPARLELGEQQANAFRAFLAKAYGEDGLFVLKDTYYLGLEVVQVEADSHLAVSGAKTHDAWEGDLPPLWTDRGGQAA